jgi:hypothetical protein
MYKTLGVSVTDTLNRNFTKFSAGALAGALGDKWQEGVPTLVSHDFNRPIGWGWPVALHFEPGITRLVEVSEMAETDTEKATLAQKVQYYLHHKWVEENKKQFEELKTLLSSHLAGDEKLYVKECVALAGKNFARKVFHQIFEIATQDKDGLIPLRHLQAIGPGVYKVDNFLLLAHPYFRRSFSRLNTLNKYFLQKFQALDNTLEPKIALDPDLVGLASSLMPYEELEYWRGPKFNTNLITIPTGVAQHEAAQRERFFFGISRTEFWWQSRDKLHILEAEELADNHMADVDDSSNNYACKYVHSMVEEDTNKIIHFDGAVRMYSEEQMLERLDTDIAKFGRHSVYTKLWRVDGTIALPIWKTLLSDFYKDNPLVGEYLGAEPAEIETEVEEQENIRETSKLEIKVEETPFNILEAGSGIRLSLAYYPLQTYNFDRVAMPVDFLGNDKKQVIAVDAEVLELRKALLRQGADLIIPATAELVSWRDRLINLPPIIHSAENLSNKLKQTIQAIALVIKHWREVGFLNVCYCIGFPVVDREVRICVAGHVNDLEEWLENSLSLPPIDIEGIRRWTDQLANYLGSNYPVSINNSIFSKMMTFSGKIWLPREPMYVQFEYKYVPEEHAIKVSLPITSEEEAILFEKKQEAGFTPAFAYLTEFSCSSCEQNYRACSCSKLFDENAKRVITKMQPLILFWTSNPRPINLGPKL